MGLSIRKQKIGFWTCAREAVFSDLFTSQGTISSDKASIGLKPWLFAKVKKLSYDFLEDDLEIGVGTEATTLEASLKRAWVSGEAWGCKTHPFIVAWNNCWKIVENFRRVKRCFRI